MRISDWSSDVCSSDLGSAGLLDGGLGGEEVVPGGGGVAGVVGEAGPLEAGGLLLDHVRVVGSVVSLALDHPVVAVFGRSEERRVGNECVSKCRSRWSPNQ